MYRTLDMYSQMSTFFNIYSLTRLNFNIYSLTRLNMLKILPPP